MAVTLPRFDGDPTRRLSRRLRLLGTGFLAVPLFGFVAFAVGEAGLGESGWWGHVLQVALVAVVGVVGWVYPRIGGPLLFGVGAALSLLMALEGDEAVATRLAAIGLLFAPLALAGLFFGLAGYLPERRTTASGSGRDS